MDFPRNSHFFISSVNYRFTCDGQIDTRPFCNDRLILRFGDRNRGLRRERERSSRPAGRAVFLLRFLGRRRGGKGKNSRCPSWCVCLSVWLGRDIYMFSRTDGGECRSALSGGDRIDAALSRSSPFPPTFETVGWYLLCWRPVDDNLRTATKKEDCLQNYTGRGRGERRRGGGHTDSRRRTKMRRDRGNVVLSNGGVGVGGGGGSPFSSAMLFGGA